LLEFLDSTLFHWSAEKAIWLGAHTLSWDARCAGIHAGIGIATLAHLALGRNAGHLPPLSILVAAALLFVPLFVDVAAVAHGLRQPSNDVRFATGIAFGQALTVFLYPAVVTLILRRGAGRAAIADGGRFCALLAAGAAAFAVKALDNAAAYYVLEALGILGMCSLFVMIALGASGALRSLQGKSGEKWSQQQDSVGERQAR
jgi:uncharacterized membrane protein